MSPSVYDEPNNDWVTLVTACPTCRQPRGRMCVNLSRAARPETKRCHRERELLSYSEDLLCKRWCSDQAIQILSCILCNARPGIMCRPLGNRKAALVWPHSDRTKEFMATTPDWLLDYVGIRYPGEAPWVEDD